MLHNLLTRRCHLRFCRLHWIFFHSLRCLESTQFFMPVPENIPPVVSLHCEKNLGDFGSTGHCTAKGPIWHHTVPPWSDVPTKLFGSDFILVAVQRRRYTERTLCKTLCPKLRQEPNIVALTLIIYEAFPASVRARPFKKHICQCPTLFHPVTRYSNTCTRVCCSWHSRRVYMRACSPAALVHTPLRGQRG